MMVPNSSTGPNPRSRRSACDRCRAYKLRCQRDEQPNEPCDRCSKARLVCTTTFEQASQRQPNRCGHLQNGSERGGRAEASRARETRLPSPARARSPPSSSLEQASSHDSGYGSRLPSAILPSPVQREYTRDSIVIPSSLEEVRESVTSWSAISPTRRALESTRDAMPLDQEEQLVCAVTYVSAPTLAMS